MAARRILVYVPIIHTQADMGALGNSIRRQLVKTFGEQWLETNISTVDRVWDEIEAAVATLDLDWEKVRIYQDGLPACGQELHIVKELAAAGSRNHRLLLELARRGAAIMGTESGDLLVEEYNRVRALLGTSRPGSRDVDANSLGLQLIERRDRFIVDQIDATLRDDEIGILFLGMLHSVARFLPKDIKMLSLPPFGGNALEVKRALHPAKRVR